MNPGPQPERDGRDPAQDPVVHPEVVGPAPSSPRPQYAVPQVVIQQSGGRLFRLFSWLGWVGLLFCIPVIIGMSAGFRDYFDTTGGIQEKFHSINEHGRDKVAVIRVEGLIQGGDGFVKRQIDRVRQDEKVKAVVLRVDSPGGTVTGSDYILHHLKKLRDEKNIPLVVSMGGMAASGGYYVAMAVGDQERSIFAEPTTTTGSIGVIIPHYDLSGLLQRYDIKDDSIASNPRKEILSMTKATSPEDREILQQYVNEAFERFKEIVRSGRPQFRGDQGALDQLATGEIFSAQQAKASGLVDEIGFIEAAIDRAIELADLSRDNVRVVTYKRTPTLLDAFRLGQARARTHAMDGWLLDLSVPRAYFLMTSLPALVQPQTQMSAN